MLKAKTGTTSLTVGVNNLFDAKPPLSADSRGYEPSLYNVMARGLTWSAQVTKKRNFGGKARVIYSTQGWRIPTKARGRSIRRGRTDRLRRADRRNRLPSSRVAGRGKG